MLAHWGRARWPPLWKTTFPNAILWMNMFQFRLKMSLNFVPNGLVDNKSSLVVDLHLLQWSKVFKLWSWVNRIVVMSKRFFLICSSPGNIVSWVFPQCQMKCSVYVNFQQYPDTIVMAKRPKFSTMNCVLAVSNVELHSAWVFRTIKNLTGGILRTL